MIEKKGSTPVMRQFWDIKQKYPNNLILFRMGDFYETFDEDALLSSSILGITLTKRANGAASKVPLAGFPYHSLEQYIHKLTKAGHSVAICEQVEDPKSVKGIVKREVVEIVTPGTSISEKFLNRGENNFIISIMFSKNNNGIAILDLSTGEFITGCLKDDEIFNTILNYEPKEILVSDSQKGQLKKILKSNKYFISTSQDWTWQKDFAYGELKNIFNVNSLKGFGIEENINGISASGSLIFYLKNKLLKKIDHISSIKSLNNNDKMIIDSSTIRNLEIFNSLNHNKKDGTLVKILDKTITSSGSRLLKKRIKEPLTDSTRINNRLDIVESFIKNEFIQNNVSLHLKSVSDIERIISRIAALKSNPRDIKQLSISLEQIDKIKNLFNNNGKIFKKISKEIINLKNIINEINHKIIEDPPSSILKGRYINKGVSRKLDEYRQLADNGANWLVNYQLKQKEITGINSLKVGFNKVFGYYIDITRIHKDKVPENYIRKQTLTNSERYFTEELKSYEEKILSSEKMMIEIESQIFTSLCNEILKNSKKIFHNSKIISKVDVALCASFLAISNKYTRPKLLKKPILNLINSRHPVIEQLLKEDEEFVCNDISMSQSKKQIAIITGPNMAGKSTFLRQIALIVLMAQIGFYVPSELAEIGIVDKLFTRVGASDNLVAGESTFMVEMNETANILNNATKNSLVILDEIGRGTSTYDGLSIAWSVTEFLHNENGISPMTLFATHYHELVELAEKLKKAFNLTVNVKEIDDKIIFLRKIVDGGADKSYGIHVADMAGLPKEVIKRANQKLNSLLKKDSNIVNEKISIENTINKSDENNYKIINEIKKIKINELTPIQALSRLNKIIEDIN